ncbi:MAG: S-adenosylmethionine:tRNA ribosyltransferase-isomerase [Actinomycetota bacterium]
MTVPSFAPPALPEGPAATAPPERRGLQRDEVRLMVATPGEILHDRFRHLPRHLGPGDVVVVNTSATRPSAVDARSGAGRAVIHLSALREDGEWVVEVRRSDGHGPSRRVTSGQRYRLEGGGRLRISAPAPTGGPRRLWLAELWTPGPVEAYLSAHGRPISYGYSEGQRPLSDYQTIFARPDDPTGASAEMPSAARPFSHPMVTDLVRRGIVVVPLTLHAGVSSLERHERPPTERFEVPGVTAAAVNAARARGRRVVSVGTTVTRALESAADADGNVEATRGWTDLVLGPERPTRVVTGLVTGWHPPDASHLLLLEAVAGAALLHRAYRSAADHSYLWHEFGDSCLLLP